MKSQVQDIGIMWREIHRKLCLRNLTESPYTESSGIRRTLNRGATKTWLVRDRNYVERNTQEISSMKSHTQKDFELWCILQPKHVTVWALQLRVCHRYLAVRCV